MGIVAKNLQEDFASVLEASSALADEPFRSGTK